MHKSQSRKRATSANEEKYDASVLGPKHMLIMHIIIHKMPAHVNLPKKMQLNVVDSINYLDQSQIKVNTEYNNL